MSFENVGNHILEGKYFCMIPWIHMHMIPNGTVFPCCISKGDLPLGRYGKSSLKDLWNSKDLKQMRLNMLNDKPSKQCEFCYKVEDQNIQTLRYQANNRFDHHFEKVQKTNMDGSLEKMEFNYFDIRFSNLCNLKCRTCGPAFSSSWAREMNQVDPTKNLPSIIQPQNPKELLAELLSKADKIEEVLIAGGEPFITPEVFLLLDKLIELGKTSVPITYITNFSLLGYEGKDLLEYWNKFETVKIKASLDGSNERGEYLRKGLSWPKIIENRKKLMQDAPRVRFELSPTVSAYNIWHLPDFLDEWISLGLVGDDAMLVTLLMFPGQMSSTILPAEFKKKVDEKYHAYFKKWKLPFFEEQLTSALNHMNSKDDSEHLRAFFRENQKWDKIRNEDLLSTFPELVECCP